VLPISDRQNDYAQKVYDQLIAAGVRAEINTRSDKVNLKIREAQLQKIPYMLVVGAREEEAGQVSVRNRKHGDQGVRTTAEFIADLQKLIAEKVTAE
jgi:threonyl-tRNA synthetase